MSELPGRIVTGLKFTQKVPSNELAKNFICRASTVSKSKSDLIGVVTQYINAYTHIGELRERVRNRAAVIASC